MKIKNNPLLQSASGMLGKTFVCRDHDGNIIMANRPKKPETMTDHQKSTRSRFLQGSNYAKVQMKIPEAAAAYEAARNKKLTSGYAVAVADYLNAPEINSVDTSDYNGTAGGTIVINATDDFKVTEVLVSILTAKDEVIESGAAVMDPENPALWMYVATVANPAVKGSKVVVRAKDKPKNVTSTEVAL